MGGGGNELGGDFGSLDDGVRLLKRAQTLVPMFLKRNVPAVKLIAALSFAVMLIEFMCIFLGAILGVMEMYELMLLWNTTLMAGIISLCSLVINVMFTAMLRAGRQNMFDGVGAVSSLGAVFSAALAGIVGAVVGSIALYLGASLLACCVLPGVAAFIVLCWTPWLLAARGEAIGDGFSTSIELGQKYWSAALGLFAANVLLGGVLAVGIGGFGMGGIGAVAARFAMGAFADPAGAFIGGAVAQIIFGFFKWVCIIASSIGIFAVTGGIMSAMEEEYFGEVIAV